ncbi:DUF6580 family putative transport protein [Ferrimonas balearica]|uniref:DUF6580 family putative transport protein n=1 Tax=Ferrimonas balearica TaxID=44012 RepID=UPI001C998BC1|nr:DUF6580 family putative transport protein [Ferrimonas balearica]MBY5992558.1 hypothetical protein [Ferrimonas balearica]
MKTKLVAVLVMIALCALYRVLPHPFNFTPVAAMGLFAGAMFASKRLALTVPLLAMLLGDLVIGLHETMLFVYLATAITAGIGMLLRHKRSGGTVALAGVASSLQFFFITNTGMWAVTDFYPHTWEGLVQCWIMGLPFMQHDLASTWLFSAILFGGYALLSRRYPQLARD